MQRTYRGVRVGGATRTITPQPPWWWPGIRRRWVRMPGVILPAGSGTSSAWPGCSTCTR